MNRHHLALGRVTLIATLLISGCSQVQLPDEVSRDLDVIKKDTLRIAVIPGSLSWEAAPGTVKGFEAEYLQRFATSLALPYTFLVFQHVDSALVALRLGNVDVIAARLHEGDHWVDRMAMTKAYDTALTALCFLKEDPWYGSYRSHSGTRVKRTTKKHPTTAWSISKWLRRSKGSVKRVKVETGVTEEELLIDVALGIRDAAILDDALASGHETTFPHLRSVIIDSTARPVIFGTRRNTPDLLFTLNSWIEDPANKRSARELKERYSGSSTRRLHYAFAHPTHFGTNYISEYDHHFKRYAELAGTSWELLAALAFKESKFDTSATSSAGALGLMQMMPRTSSKMAHDSLVGVEGSIFSAARYLRQLDGIWTPSVPDKDERMAFVLASYNAGLAHIKDAQRLADEYDLDPTKWTANVERTLLLLSKSNIHRSPIVKHGYCRGYETFLFVREVLSYCEHYQDLEIK